MKKEKLLKMRNKFSQTDIYYSFSNWEEKEIDGVKFIPVMKTEPKNNVQHNVHFMRKDSLELVK